MGILAIVAVILGIVWLLVTEHTLVFWIVFVPLALLFIISMVKFLKTPNRGLGYFMTTLVVFFAIIVALVIVVTPDKCEHDDIVTWYTFQTDDTISHSNVRPYCRDCDKAFRYTNFKGELVDKSYLSAIIEHSDGNELVPGEYYTVTVTVPLGYYGYGSDQVELTCQVENAEFRVRFGTIFREEFKEQVRSVEEGDEITFRGRFSDKGCEFTDCELITK